MPDHGVSEKSKEYRMQYRQRVFYCKKCDLRNEVIGGGPLGTCHCCGEKLADMPKEIDNIVTVKRTVEPNSDSRDV